MFYAVPRETRASPCLEGRNGWLSQATARCSTVTTLSALLIGGYGLGLRGVPW